MKDIIKDLIKSLMLFTAIYSGAKVVTTAANPHDYFCIPMVILCGAACAAFVLIEDDKKD